MSRMFTQEQLLKSLKPCPKCENSFPEWEEVGESGIHKRLRCLSCGYETSWQYQSIVCINEWNGEK